MTELKEETPEFYKNLNLHIVGIPKDKTPPAIYKGMTDAELVAFYSEKYVDNEAKKPGRECFSGLFNMIRDGEFYLYAGCGNGEVMELLHQRSIKGIGLDLSIPNILRGRIKYPHLKFIHGFAEEIPFKDDYFDIVLLSNSIGHFRDPKVVLAECLRVAKKGLAICILNENELKDKPINPLIKKEILNLFEFYKLSIKSCKADGRELSRAEILLKIENLPEVFIRAEKTSETNVIIKNILNIAGKKSETKSKEEILNTDQWSKDFEHDRHEIVIARFKLVSHLIEGNRALEIGCGNGDGSVEMAKVGFDVTGIDISQSGIKQAIEIATKKNVQEKTEFLAMDATSLSFYDNSFDTIIIPEVFEHIRNPRKILEEAIRVVRNGGRIIISVPDGLLIPWEGHLRVFFKDTLTTELSQYTEFLEWHELPFKRWLICSFFVKKNELDMKEGPEVDILMPTFDGKRTIRKSIESVVNQTYRNWNLVIVNYGEENVSDVIKDFNDNRIKYICVNNKRRPHALNVGIKNSNGEYIAYLDDNDIFYPIHLEILVKTALEKKQDFVYTDWYRSSVDDYFREFKRDIDYRIDITPAMLLTQNYLYHNCFLHKRSLFDIAGTYDETLNIFVDWDIARRLAYACKPYHIWSFTCEHVMHYSNNNSNNNGVRNKISDLLISDREGVLKSIKKLVEKTDDLHATPDELKESIKKSTLSMNYLYYYFEITGPLQTNDAQIKTLEAEVQSLDQSPLQKVVLRYLLEKNKQVVELVSTLQSTQQNLQSMQQSVVWQLLMKYDTKILNPLFPQESLRRKYYDFLLTWLKNMIIK